MSSLFGPYWPLKVMAVIGFLRANGWQMPNWWPKNDMLGLVLKLLTCRCGFQARILCWLGSVEKTIAQGLLVTYVKIQPKTKWLSERRGSRGFYTLKRQQNVQILCSKHDYDKRVPKNVSWDLWRCRVLDVFKLEYC